MRKVAANKERVKPVDHSIHCWKKQDLLGLVGVNISCLDNVVCFYICCIYLNAFQANFIMEAKTL